jgi:ABC-type uncharacterized transport system involved in gliding motility auxiliary subunit
MERRTSAKVATGAYLLIAAAILVVANVLSYGNYKRFDVTDQQRHTLSEGSKRLVCEGLKSDLQVDVYVTRGMAKTDIFIQDLTSLLSEYEQAKYAKTDGSASPPSKFKFSIIEPKTEDEKKAAKDEGLQEQLLGESSETADQTTVAVGYMGFVIKYGSEKEVIPTWPPDSTNGVEFFLSNKIREVRDRADKLEYKFGLLTGKDELKISDNVIAPGPQPFNLKQVFQEYFPFYQFEDVDLQNGDTEINKELKGIIVTQPGKEYTEKELRRIDEFLMLGDKSAVFYVSAVNVKASDKDMKGTLNSWGLEKLFDGYGVEMKREVVLDFAGAFRQPAMTQMGQQIWVVAPGITMLTDDGTYEDDEALIDTKFVPFFRMPQVAFPFASPLIVHKDRQPGAEVKVVARSNPRSSVDASDNISLKYSDEVRERAPQEQRNLAVAVTGKLKSAFAGKGDDMGVKANPESPADSRVLIVSSSQFLANPFARAGNPPPMPPQLQMMGAMGGDRELQMVARPYLEVAFRPMIFSFKNTLDWMSNDSDLVAVSAKMLGEPTLTYSVKKPRAEEGDTEESMKKKYEAYKQERAEQQSLVSWVLTLLPAALIALFGVLRWWLRESSRDTVRV